MEITQAVSVLAPAPTSAPESEPILVVPRPIAVRAGYLEENEFPSDDSLPNTQTNVPAFHLISSFGAQMDTVPLGFSFQNSILDDVPPQKVEDEGKFAFSQFLELANIRFMNSSRCSSIG